MKRTILNGFVAISVFAISSGAFGQLASADENVTNDYSNGFIRGHIIAKAARNFVKDFKNVTYEKWYELNNGLLAKFERDNINYRVFYDKKGNWTNTIRTYTEDKLDKGIRHEVKSTYYDFEIRFVNEIESPVNNFTYILHMEGKTEWIDLRVHNGEMDEILKFNKAEE